MKYYKYWQAFKQFKQHIKCLVLRGHDFVTRHDWDFNYKNGFIKVLECRLCGRKRIS